MIFIHCADLHLDSAFGALEREKAKQRRDEILSTFGRMVRYAQDKGARAILIAGDLFDTATRQQVRIKRQAASIIKGASGIDFLYLRGNHDAGDFFSTMDDKIANLKTFSESEWTSYQYGDVVITGRETAAGALDADVYARLTLDTMKTNIVMLHGDISSGGNGGSAAAIDLKQLENKGIDYLALGHIHKRQSGKLDKHGLWCYPGCLEGRGFDECGEKGFVVLDVKEHNIVRSFLPIASRTIHEVPVQLAGSLSFDDIKDRIEEAVSGIPQKDFVKVVLKGDVSEDTDVEAEAYLPLFNDRFFFFKIYDETEVAADYSKYEGDISLKGFFIRKVNACDTLSEHDKGEVIRMGIRALRGAI